MKLSIVSTLYQSSLHIREFHKRMHDVAVQIAADDYEIVYVNDGSPDESMSIVLALMETDPRIVLVDLSRNFGHHKAMMTGLSHAKGDLIFLIDCDLEEEPEWLVDFQKQMMSNSCDVIYGKQAQRKGSRFESWSGRWFYLVFNAMTGMELPENVVTARLMTRRYVDALLLHREREVFLAGLWHITGFVQLPFIIKKHSNSKTTYTFRRKVSLLANSITSFSNAPLVGIFYVGLFISCFAAVFAAYLVVNKLFFSKPLSGWTSVMASLWLIGGILISCIGVVGIYLSKIFSETKQRPYTIVRKIYEQHESE